jgi:hypothetical protein
LTRRQRSVQNVLYVSPAKDLVAVWYSTAMFTDLTQYARQIALDTPPAR